MLLLTECLDIRLAGFSIQVCFLHVASIPTRSGSSSALKPHAGHRQASDNLRRLQLTPTSLLPLTILRVALCSPPTNHCGPSLKQRSAPLSVLACSSRTAVSSTRERVKYNLYRTQETTAWQTIYVTEICSKATSSGGAYESSNMIPSLGGVDVEQNKRDANSMIWWRKVGGRAEPTAEL